MDVETARFVDGDRALHLDVDLRVYRLAAIQKTAYRLADRCTAAIGSPTETTIPLTLRFRDGTSEAIARDVLRAFYQELLDQELREQIGEQTAPLRSLILAQAFSKSDLIRRE